jgi:hypothetical protein
VLAGEPWAAKCRPARNGAARTLCLFREGKGAGFVRMVGTSCRSGTLQRSCGCAGPCRSRSLAMPMKSSTGGAGLSKPVTVGAAGLGPFCLSRGYRHSMDPDDVSQLRVGFPGQRLFARPAKAQSGRIAPCGGLIQIRHDQGAPGRSGRLSHRYLRRSLPVSMSARCR